MAEKESKLEKEDPDVESSVEIKPDSMEEERGEEAQKVPEEAVRRKIIIVDSKDKTLDEALSALRKGEHNVIGVESTEEFFEMTRTQTFRESSDMKAVTPEEYWKIANTPKLDMLITDIDIKDLDGWEFIFRLKFDNRFYEYWETPILVRSDIPITTETVKKIPAESIHDYMPKKVKGKELLAKVDKYFDTRSKIAQTKKKIVHAAGYRAANEYERLTLAIRIRLIYAHALKTKLEKLKAEEGDADEIKKIQETLYLQNRELIKYERRKREIKNLVKKVKKDDGGDGAEEKP